MGFERYVDYALDVPMYFVKRGDQYIDVSGKSFRDFFAGELADLPGERPTVSDWANHVSTIFPEVRLKRYLEMRGADGGPWRRLPSLTAYWMGLLYDDDALDGAWELVKGWNADDRQRLRDEVPQRGFKAVVRNTNAHALAQETLRLSRRGLEKRAKLDRNGRDETRFLRPLEEIVARGITPAEELLEKYFNEWNESVAPLYDQYAY
jgi:glutamate--cysteine ligase